MKKEILNQNGNIDKIILPQLEKLRKNDKNNHKICNIFVFTIQMLGENLKILLRR